MKNLTLEQKVDALIATSPLRFLLVDRSSMVVAPNEKNVFIAGVKVGDVEWSRHVTTSRQMPTVMQMVGRTLGFNVRDSVAQIKDYSAIDILGQKWLGRGNTGEPIRFAKCREI